MAGSLPTWREIGRAARALAAHRSGDRFVKTLLAGAIKVAKQRGNPIRGNLAAAALREAVNHIIHKLSPDEEVRACVWFVQAKDTATITRKQRASYIIKAGLPDDFVSDTLKIDVKAHAADLVEMIDELNRATHVRPETIFTDGVQIRWMFDNVLSGIDALLEVASDNRRAVEDAIATALHNSVFARLISEAIPELDELSMRTAVDNHWIDAIEVAALDATQISYRVDGTVAVELQYGSNSDVASGIGFRDSDSYPYEAHVSCSVTDPLNVSPDDIDVKVDNSSFFE